MMYADSHLVEGTDGLGYREPTDLLTMVKSDIDPAPPGVGAHTFSGDTSFGCLARGARSGVVVLKARVLTLDPNTKVRCSIDMNEDYYLRPHLNVEP